VEAVLGLKHTPAGEAMLSPCWLQQAAQLIKRAETEHQDNPVSLREDERFQQPGQHRWCWKALSPADLSVNSIKRSRWRTDVNSAFVSRDEQQNIVAKLLLDLICGDTCCSW